jgi:Tol biopolymer transport system component
MASGKQAFARNSSVETMAAIVRDEPSAIEEKIPAPLKWIIDRCLQKEPEQRYESTRDLYRDLRNLRDHFSEAYTSAAFTPVVGDPPHSRGWRFTAICAACIALTAVLVYVLKPSGQDIANYRYTPFASDANSPVWSPDGNAVAYSSKVNGIYEAFLRYLNSPIPVQLSHEAHSVWPIGWSSDKAHLIIVETTDNQETPTIQLYSIAIVGGDPEFIMDIADGRTFDLSRDGTALAALGKSKDGEYTVELSDPLGSPLRPYIPSPFASKSLEWSPNLEFSSDGKRLLLYRAGDHGKQEAWLIPYPAGSKPPQRILQRLPDTRDTPSLSWMPDNRHIVISLAAGQNSGHHLSIADIGSNELTPLTIGNQDELHPSVSPDGRSLIYEQDSSHLDVVSVSVDDGSTNTLIGIGREDIMAAWSARQAKLAWVTDRNGPGRNMASWARWF